MRIYADPDPHWFIFDRTKNTEFFFLILFSLTKNVSAFHWSKWFLSHKIAYTYFSKVNQLFLVKFVSNCLTSNTFLVLNIISRIKVFNIFFRLQPKMFMIERFCMTTTGLRFKLSQVDAHVKKSKNLQCLHCLAES